MRNKSLHILSALAFLVSGCSSYSTFSTDNEATLYKDPDAIDAYFKRFVAVPLSDPAPMYWLSLHADRLPTLFRYELARRLQASGMHEQALKEVAKARILRDMEVEQCKSKSTNRVKDMLFVTNTLELMIHGADRLTDSIWITAIDEALTWGVPQRVGGFTSPWICGKGNVDMTFAAIHASQAKYMFLKNDFEKIRASSVTK